MLIIPASVLLPCLQTNNIYSRQIEMTGKSIKHRVNGETSTSSSSKSSSSSSFLPRLLRTPYQFVHGFLFDHSYWNIFFPAVLLAEFILGMAIIQRIACMC
jgi:hypothetical protein